MTIINPSCVYDVNGPNVVKPDFSTYALYMEYECDISTIDLIYFGSMSRTRLANIVIACDALICLLWAINTCWLGRAI